MARDLTTMELLAALQVTQNMTLPDITAISEYAQHVGVQYEEPAQTLEQALDMALDFFNEPPDVEAAKQAEKVQALHSVSDHDANTCPDCGGPCLDEVDIEQALDLWHAVRGIVDKYEYDMFVEHGEPPDGREEC